MRRAWLSIFASTILIGCTPSLVERGKPMDQGALPEEVRLKMEEIMKAHQAKKRYDSLDENVFASVSDVELEDVVIEVFYKKARASGSSPLEFSRQLTPQWQAFYLVWLVDAQVLNGGFNQLFWNYRPDDLGRAVDALSLLGSPAAARIFAEAKATAVEELKVREVTHDKTSLQSFSQSYKLTNLNRYDKPWAEQQSNLSLLRIKFIRENAKYLSL
jgi:Domain of unknown function (DUF4375)